MKHKIDLLIVTHLPVFYKVNLYNELAKTKRIHVIYIASNTLIKRSDDFLTLNNCNHSYSVITDSPLERRNIFSSLFSLIIEYRKYDFSEILVSGWELPEFQFLVYATNSSRNSLALESTAHEGTHFGWRAFLKRAFLKNVTTVYASGSKHLELLDKYSFGGKRVITKGVGLINYGNFNSENLIESKPAIIRFLYVGRLSKEKNIVGLINSFKNRENAILSICGTGPLSDFVIASVNKNIEYRGVVNNNDLIRELNHSHCLILPSLLEPWGLVIEEALYSNVPVIVSSNAGASILVENGVNGYLFDPSDDLNLHNVIDEFIDRFDIVEFSKIKAGSVLIKSKDLEQVSSYAKD
jgi:glycosyltransferase involved in cell wall biosynthesis